MKKMRFKSIISVLMIVSMFCTSCNLFATQKVIDNIIPDHNKRIYSVADFIPYKYEEIKNAVALYGMERNNFFEKNTATASKIETGNGDKDAFYKELMLRSYNYKIIKKRLDMYNDEDEKKAVEMKEERKKEYNDYYSIGNARSLNIIKKYNNGETDGMPLMSIRAKMDTATVSDLTDIYKEVFCEIYKPVVIDEKKYQNLKIGDKIILAVPSTSSTLNCSETYEKEFTYVATDSLLYKDSDGNEAYYFISDSDGKNPVRRIVDFSGMTVETYMETVPLQFSKLCRIVETKDRQELLTNKTLKEHNFDEIVERALCGGYLIEKYKDYVYANCITTNHKGYITSLTYYNNQRARNRFYYKLVK